MCMCASVCMSVPAYLCVLGCVHVSMYVYLVVSVRAVFDVSLACVCVCVRVCVSANDYHGART